MNTINNQRNLPLTNDIRDSLKRYHQLDGQKNGSPIDGVQMSPLCQQDESALRQHIDGLSTYLAQQKDVQFQPSPQKDPARKEFRADLAQRSARYIESSAQTMLECATNLILDPAIKALVNTCLKTVPQQFYNAPSSSTGKYHPADEINKGGLLLHTCRVVAMAQHLSDFYQISPQERDILTAGLILHDTCKGGEPWQVYAKDHGEVAAAHIAKTTGGNSTAGKEIQRVAFRHMAQWSQAADGSRTPMLPETRLDQIASYADYLASQDNVYITPTGYNAPYLNPTNK